MSKSAHASSDSECSGLVTDPKCLRCLRLQLRATCLAVFLKNEHGWRLGGYEGDKPATAAEVEFYSMLKAGLPEKLYGAEHGLVMNDANALEAWVGQLKALFDGSAVVAGPVHPAGRTGLRIAWRDASDPFSADELETLRCFQQCPEDKW